jgi:hypothetical protein
MQNPTQYLALVNLQKYIQNNLQVLNNVNNLKANGLPHRIYVTLTDLARLFNFYRNNNKKKSMLLFTVLQKQRKNHQKISDI